MWTKLTDCGKQLTIFTKLREPEGDHYNEYQVIEVEFDQFKLKLISNDQQPASEKLEQVLSCKQLLEYGFELELPATSTS